MNVVTYPVVSPCVFISCKCGTARHEVCYSFILAVGGIFCICLCVQLQNSFVIVLCIINYYCHNTVARIAFFRLCAPRHDLFCNFQFICDFVIVWGRLLFILVPSQSSVSPAPIRPQHGLCCLLVARLTFSLRAFRCTIVVVKSAIRSPEKPPTCRSYSEPGFERPLVSSLQCLTNCATRAPFLVQ